MNSVILINMALVASVFIAYPLAHRRFNDDQRVHRVVATIALSTIIFIVLRVIIAVFYGQSMPS